MTTPNNALSVKTVGLGFLEGLGFSVSHMDPLEKVVKLSYRFIDLTNKVTGVIYARSIAAHWTTIESQLRQTATFFETVRFLGTLKLLFAPNEKTGFCLMSKYAKRVANVSTYKKVDRIFLGLHTGCKMILGMDKYGLIKLGQFAAVKVGSLGLFAGIVDGFMVVSSVFGTIDNSLIVKKKGEEIDVAEHKIEKWQLRSDVINQIRAGNETSLNFFKGKYEGKLAARGLLLEQRQKLAVEQARIADANDPEYSKLNQKQRNTLSKITAAKAQKVAHKIDKLVVLEGRLSKIANKQFGELADELAQKNSTNKVRQWNVTKANLSIARTKGWMGVVACVAKIAVIALALTLLYLNYWVAPAAITLICLGIINDTSGLVKILYTEFKKPATLNSLYPTKTVEV